MLESVVNPGIVEQSQKSLVRQNSPYRNARTFLQQNYLTKDGLLTLRHGADTWYAWTGTYYQELSGSTLRSQVWRWLAGCEVETTVPDEHGRRVTRRVGFEPSPKHVSDLIDALKGLTDVPNYDGSQLGVFLGEGDFPPPERLIPFQNGLLDLDAYLQGEGRLLPHTPLWFSVSCLPHRYDPEARCPVWEQCIDEWTMGDQERQDLLQMWMGLNMTSNMSHHKMLFLLGRGRNGKGTYADVLQWVVGRDNCCNPSFSELGQSFALMGFIGKLAAIFGDAHLSSGRESDVIVERIKRITGGDPVDINRKNRAPLTGVSLTTRFTVLSNGLPRLPDASAVIADRMLFVRFLSDFRGREDLKLKDKLRAELPGIANWALRGLALLHQRGRLTQPACDAQVQGIMSDQSSPIRAFVEQHCVLEEGAEIEAELLRRRWATWCEAEGHRPGSSGHFSALLLSVDPRITSVRRRPPGSRKLDTKKSYYLGITLNPESMARVRGDFLSDTGELLDQSGTEPAFEEMDLVNLFTENSMI